MEDVVDVVDVVLAVVLVISIVRCCIRNRITTKCAGGSSDVGVDVFMSMCSNLSLCW